MAVSQPDLRCISYGEADGLEPTGVVPWTSFPGRDHPPMRTLVPTDPLSYRDLEKIMAERGLTIDHSTIARWVLRYARS